MLSILTFRIASLTILTQQKDIQHKDIYHGDIQYNKKKWDPHYNVMLVMLSICYAMFRN
jgi:hypothetical protein